MEIPSEAEARLALSDVERARQHVIDEIGMPWWYWWGLAACWIGLGVMADLGVPWWVTTIATVAVGAVHASVSSRLLAGRQRTSGLRVRADVVSRHSSVVVVLFLLSLVAMTVVAALLLDEDGAGHPATWASVMVAIVVVLGGPQVMAWIRNSTS